MLELLWAAMCSTRRMAFLLHADSSLLSVDLGVRRPKKPTELRPLLLLLGFGIGSTGAHTPGFTAELRCLLRLQRSCSRHMILPGTMGLPKHNTTPEAYAVRNGGITNEALDHNAGVWLVLIRAKARVRASSNSCCNPCSLGVVLAQTNNNRLHLAKPLGSHNSAGVGNGRWCFRHL